MKSNLNLETGRRHSPTSLTPLRTTGTAATHSRATRFRHRLGRAPLPLLALLALALTMPVREASAQPQGPPQIGWDRPPFYSDFTHVTLYPTLLFSVGETTTCFEWGTTTNYGNSDCGTMYYGPGMLPFEFHEFLSLVPGIMYHFRFTASNDYGTTSSGDGTIAALGGPPQVSTLPASDISANSATLYGSVFANLTPTTAWFLWGATTNYGSLISATDTGSGTISAQLAALTPGTTYHFQAVASNIWGVAYGSDQSFTTLGPPLVSTLPATGVSANSATLNGTVNPNGRPTTAWFQWGATTNYGNLTSVTALGSGTNALPLSAPLAGLTPSVTYHFRIAATNDNGLVYGSDQSFTTASLQTEFNYTTNNGTITITGYIGPDRAVTIPSTINGLPVTSIGMYAFEGSSLTSVMIPNSVNTIGLDAFFVCGSLTNVSIGNSVTSIESGAFSGCTSLTNIMIPESVASIAVEAFSWCTSLSAISVNGLNSAYSSVDGVLFDKSQTTIVVCPGGKAGNYTIPNSVTTIELEAFFDCTSLTRVTIPNSVTGIGYGAFYYCSGLTNVTIPNSVTSIGDTAFFNCPGLTEVYFQGTPLRLGGSSVFAYDDNATVYYLPGTTGWGSTFGGRPTALWFLPNPLVLTSGPGFGVQSNAFGFIISWATNTSVVVEACTNPANHSWAPRKTNALTGGWSYFSDPQWANYPGRFYRLRSP